LATFFKFVKAVGKGEEVPAFERQENGLQLFLFEDTMTL
jgi:hypothetical protein